MPLVLYYTRCKLFAVLIWKYCLINKIPFGDSQVNMLYLCKQSTVMGQTSNTMNERFMLERNKIMSRWCILDCDKKLQMIVFGNWNKTTTKFFLEIGKSSSNVQNIFKDSSLTGHCGYWESRLDIYYILEYFLIHCTYSKILNTNNEFCCLRGNIYLSEVSIFS